MNNCSNYIFNYSIVIIKLLLQIFYTWTYIQKEIGFNVKFLLIDSDNATIIAD